MRRFKPQCLRRIDATGLQYNMNFSIATYDITVATNKYFSQTKILVLLFCFKV